MNPDSNFGDAAETTVTSRGDDRQVGAQTGGGGPAAGTDRAAEQNMKRPPRLSAAAAVWGTVRASRCTMMRHETQVRCPSGRVVRTKGETVQGVWHRPVG
jgi:hypothetical protein